MVLRHCLTMLRLNLGFSATVAAVLGIGGRALGADYGWLELAGNFLAAVQICLASVGLGFAFFVFQVFQGHTRPLYWNLGISGRRLTALGVASAGAGVLLLGVARWALGLAAAATGAAHG
jgi:hypothetical protein